MGLVRKTLTFFGAPGPYRVKTVDSSAQVAAALVQKTVGVAVENTTPTANIFRVRGVGADGLTSDWVVLRVLPVQGQLDAEYWYRLRGVKSATELSPWLYSDPIRTAASEPPPDVPPGGDDSIRVVSSFLLDLFRFYLTTKDRGAKVDLEAAAASFVEALSAADTLDVAVDRQFYELARLVVSESADIWTELLRQVLQEPVFVDVVESCLRSFVMYPGPEFVDTGWLEQSVSRLYSTIEERLSRRLFESVCAHIYDGGDPDSVLSEQAVFYALRSFVSYSLSVRLFEQYLCELLDFAGLFVTVFPFERLNLDITQSFRVVEALEEFLEDRADLAVKQIPEQLVLSELIDLLFVAAAFLGAGDLRAVLNDHYISSWVKSTVHARTDDGRIYFHDFFSTSQITDRVRLLAELPLSFKFWIALQDSPAVGFLDDAHHSWLKSAVTSLGVALAERVAASGDSLAILLEGLRAALRCDALVNVALGVETVAGRSEFSDTIPRFDIDKTDWPVVLYFGETAVEGVLNPTGGPGRKGFIMGEFILGEAVMGE